MGYGFQGQGQVQVAAQQVAANVEERFLWDTDAVLIIVPQDLFGSKQCVHYT